MSARWTEELELATAAARAAGAVTLRYFGAGPRIEAKPDGSPVTIADREAERLLRARIGERYPDDGVLGEELGERPGRSGRRWVLDPIDGTFSFIHGVPLYGVMVALEADGRPVVGVLHFPALGDTVAAARGLGCRWNGRPTRVSAVDTLERALVLTSGDARRDGVAGVAGRAAAVAGRAAGLDRLAAAAGRSRTWGDCYGYALVATGRAEAMLDPVLNVWDAAAVRPIIEEAGGVFTDWSGAPDHSAGHAVATNAALADAVRGVLATGSDLPAVPATRPDLRPVIAQHAHTGEVLMLGHASPEALERTRATGLLTFHSRSRGRLWTKGETSGNTLRVVSVHADCDGDALLARVLPDGPTCHTGARSCFGAPPTLPALADAIEARVEARVERVGDRSGDRPGDERSRQDTAPAVSHTARLLGDRNLRLKKLGEEAAELAVACADGDRVRVTEEAADLLYHALVAARAAGVTAAEVLAALDRRRGSVGAVGRAGSSSADEPEDQ